MDLLTEKEKNYLKHFTSSKDKAILIQHEKHRKPVNLVDTLPKLEELLADLPHYNLWGIDVEYYSEEHSFVCTLQLSNIDRSYVVDALLLREHINKLGDLFEQPTKLKIFHGCDNDIRWLCEDFSFRTVCIHDTCKAHSILTGEKVSISLKKLT